MISYPMPRFDQQKSEVLQRFSILSDTSNADTNQTAKMARLAFNVPMVLISLNQRYREWFDSRVGIPAESEKSVEAFCSLAQLSQATFVVEDVAADPYFANEQAVKGAPGIHFFAGTPLRNPHGQRFGTLCLMDTKPRTFTQREIALLNSMALLVSNDICLRSAGRYAVRDLVEAEQDKCELYDLATTDELTSALNRRSFFYLSKREMRRRARHRNAMSVIMLDIDHFKQVNDVHGHAMGDTVIQRLSKVISDTSRDEDIFGRLGGEEFGLVLPDTNLQGAAILAERIRASAAALSFKSGRETFKITVSLGVDEPGFNDTDINDALDRADQALYRAKQNGRNRVEAPEILDLRIS
ncbi:MAG: sensor domain-containing diguanylate cyclase [Hyphomonadaceae bacterium]